MNEDVEINSLNHTPYIMCIHTFHVYTRQEYDLHRNFKVYQLINIIHSLSPNVQFT